jgi:hypothetical protein
VSETETDAVDGARNVVPPSSAVRTERRTNFARWSRFAPWIVGAVALVVFLPSVFDGFVFDDVVIIQNNPAVHGWDGVRAAFSVWRWSEGARDHAVGGLGYFRPLVTLSYIVDWTLGRGRAGFFHATNVLWHAIAAVLATRVAVRWTNSTAWGVAAALLFALHPTRTESVVWVSGRTDLMMTVFLLAALELARAAIGAANAPRPVAAADPATKPTTRVHGARVGLFLFAATLSACAAFLCKEAAAGLPLLFLVEVLATHGERERRPWRLSLAGATALSATYLGVRFLFMPILTARALVTPLDGLVTVAAYAKRVVFPWPQTFFYQPAIAGLGGVVHPAALVGLGACVCAGYVAVVVVALRRDRVAAAALVAAAAFIAPVLNFFNTGIPNTSADRFLYLPLLLVAIGAARLASRWPAPSNRRTAWLAFGGVLAVACGVDGVRMLDFRDDSTLWRAELGTNPENPLALRELARVAVDTGDVAGAEALLDHALSPGALRFVQIATPWFRLITGLRRLDLFALRVADGDVVRLEALLGELRAIAKGDERVARADPAHATDVPRIPDVDPASFRTLMRDPSRALLFATGGIVAARLGHRAEARAWLGRVPIDDFSDVPNPARLVLARAAVFDFEGARGWLSRLSGGPNGPPLYAIELAGQIAGAERRFSDSNAPRTVESRVRRAEALADLGAYLAALRELRPAYDAAPDAALARLYVQLLTFAGLPSEATLEATRWLGPEQGPVAVRALVAELPAELRHCRPVAEPSPWWQPRVSK